ncbi:DUF6644 family protein [Novosphingobium sp. FKTRR1]|uniref:DUF6644 family protein n=1 Tax=unclassified Novosphingobium TaxID=2644732 RepID=UPI001CF0D321|nr:DUF6644 family protein [Novosphingobium sp. FKTRR1]
MEFLTGFAAWLGASPITALVTSHGWIVPAIQVVHILAIAAVVIGAALINLRALGLAEQGRSLRVVLDAWLPVLYSAVGILAFTGFLLIASEPDRALFRTIFWVKLGLIVAALLVTRAHGLAARDTGDQSSVAVTRTPLHTLLAVASLLLWVGVIYAGRWIAYADGWPGAPS